ncbi:MAG TPA: MFS transporter [Dehalococcoidia bacterium]|nr:MFS transporter [Dehalococcoidia bacterium]
MANPEGHSQEPFRLRSLVFSVYLPTIFFSIGQGAVIPAIPLFARELGSSVAIAAFIVAMRGIGQLVGDIPAGLAVSKWGDKGAMVAGTTLIGVVAIGASLSPTPIALGALVFVMGIGWAFWQIARLAYVSEVAPLEQRGRALSMTGGMNRIGNFIGPALGGFLGEYAGYEAAFLLQAAMGLAAAALMFIVVREAAGDKVQMLGRGVRGRMAETLSNHHDIYLRAGPPVIALGVLRQARQVFLPLWGDHIGLGGGQIGLITSASFFIDASIFYPVGLIMDTKGRKWVAVPCLITMAAGLAILPLTDSFTTFLIIGLLTGLGNGFGAGINMTLGADFAPDVGKGEFLGVWRLISDVGQGGGPVVISAVIGVASLGAASVVSGGIGFVGAALMVLFVPEPLKRRVVPRFGPSPPPVS